MTRSPRRMLCAAVIAGCMVVGASPAVARPTKIAVTQIAGDTGGLRDTLADALDGDDRIIVSNGQLDRTIDKLGLDDELSDRDVRRLSAALEADVVLLGAFDSRAHRLRLTIFANGRKAKLFNIQVASAGSEKFRKLVHTTLVAKLAAAVAAESRMADDDDDDARPAGKPGKQVDEDSPKKPARAKRAHDDAAAEADESPKRSGKAKAKTTEAAVGDDERGNKRKGRVTEDAVGDGERATKKARARKAGDDTVAGSDALSSKQGRARKASDAAMDDSDELPPKKPRARKPSSATPAETDELPKQPRGKTAPDAAMDDSDELPPKKPRVRQAGGTALDDDRSNESPGNASRATGKQVAERDDDDAPQSTEARFEPGTRGRPRSTNLAAARADLGTSLTARSLTFRTTRLDNPPTPYKNAPVPGARFEGEIYPLAVRDPSSRLAGIGVAGDFDQTIALTLRASAEPTVPLKATERHYSIGLRYRLALGHTPASPTVTFGAGYGARTFTVDRKALMSAASLDLPDVNYKLFDPGLAFCLPVGGRFAVTLGGRALLVTSAGAIQRADQYGSGTILGGSAAAGVEMIFGDRIAVRIAGEATQLSYSFAGTGTLATSRDGNAATVDVRGATDRYYGGAATLAVLY